MATRYAEEAVEWVKQEKDDDWTVFIARGTVGGTTYCLNTLSWTSGSCADYSLGTIFKREIVLKNSGDAVVTVYWQDMGTQLSVPIKTAFKLLE